MPKVEWSGPLFYSLEGDIKKPETLVVTLQDILPLDMGTAAFTKYAFDGRFVDYIMDDKFPERVGYEVGHIHSHNTMNVFFSGTDTEELHDNAENHNMYLSLIVNNFMDFTAKIAIYGKVEQADIKVPVYANDQEGKVYEIGQTVWDIKDYKLYLLNCDVQSSIVKPETPDWFVEQVATIMKPKPIPAYTPAYQQKPFTPNTPATKKVVDKKEYAQKFAKEVDFNKWEEEEAEQELEKELYQEQLEDFVVTLLKFGEGPSKDESVEDALEEMCKDPRSNQEIATSILECYPSVFDKVFEEENTDEFIMITWDVIAELEDYSGTYGFIDTITKVLENFIENFKKEIA